MTSLSTNALMTPVQLCLVRACVPDPFGALRWASCVRDFSGLDALVPGDENYRRGPGFVFDFFRAGGTLPDLHGCERKRVNFGRKFSARVGSYARNQPNSPRALQFGA